MQAEDIRIACQMGTPQREMAEKYGVSPATVSLIANGKRRLIGPAQRPRVRPRCGAGKGQIANATLDADIVRELRVEARRQGRSVPWLMRRAWELASAAMKARPGGDE